MNGAESVDLPSQADDDDPVEAAFRDAPLDDLPETEAERAMMATARATPDAGVPNADHHAALADRNRRER
jgi:hypothetical protein